MFHPHKTEVSQAISLDFVPNPPIFQVKCTELIQVLSTWSQKRLQGRVCAIPRPMGLAVPQDMQNAVPTQHVGHGQEAHQALEVITADVSACSRGIQVLKNYEVQFYNRHLLLSVSNTFKVKFKNLRS